MIETDEYLVGIITGSFDIIHPGYIKMFKDAREKCDILTVLLNSTPENKKYPCVFSLKERFETLHSIKYINGGVFVYNSEQELETILKESHFDVRFLGDDYINKSITGKDTVPIIYLKRDTGWSTSKVKDIIRNFKD